MNKPLRMRGCCTSPRLYDVFAHILCSFRVENCMLLINQLWGINRGVNGGGGGGGERRGTTFRLVFSQAERRSGCFNPEIRLVDRRAFYEIN
jgi:hypothetical protein